MSTMKRSAGRRAGLYGTVAIPAAIAVEPGFALTERTR